MAIYLGLLLLTASCDPLLIPIARDFDLAPGRVYHGTPIARGRTKKHKLEEFLN